MRVIRTTSTATPTSTASTSALLIGVTAGSGSGRRCRVLVGRLGNGTRLRVEPQLAPERRRQMPEQPAEVLEDGGVGLRDADQGPVPVGGLTGEDQQIVAQLDATATVVGGQQLLDP